MQKLEAFPDHTFASQTILLRAGAKHELGTLHIIEVYFGLITGSQLPVETGARGMTTFNKYLDNPTVRITLFVGGIDEKARRLMFITTQAAVVFVCFFLFFARFPCGTCPVNLGKEQFRALEEGVDIVARA